VISRGKYRLLLADWQRSRIVDLAEQAGVAHYLSGEDRSVQMRIEQAVRGSDERDSADCLA
jgi:hypothetical protein